MINKLAKAQKSWIAKLILTLTALSFMSLFGITGYISSASNNRTVIKVDNVEVSQAEFSYEFQKELNVAKNLMNIDLNEEQNEQIRSSLMNAVAQKMLKDAIIDRTAKKHHVSFRPELIGRIVMSEPSFQDLSGQFNRDVFRRVLSENHITESEYTRSVERGLAEQILISWPTKNINVPQALLDAELKIDNRRRTFRYVLINPQEMKVERQISQDEIEQYYDDFASSFIAPETRDLSVVYLSIDDVLSQINVSDDEIKAYYDEHIEDYETPEKRNVLQMMFENEDDAQDAYLELQKGRDFYAVADSKAHQTKEETDLGVVAENELVFEIAEDVFALKKGAYTKPVQVGDIWQIMKVTEVTPPSKADYAKVSKEIKDEILNEGLYDEIYATVSKIEDELGAGKTLEEIASKFNTSVLKVQALNDEGTASEKPEKLANLISSSDFIDAAFSYAEKETSQTIETDEGIAILRVDAINESHQKSIEQVSPEIKTLWEANEKDAIAQEKINDIMHDLENGADFAQTVRRYGLTSYKSQPLTRNETFADLTYADIKELFMQELKAPYQTKVSDSYIIAIAEQDYQNSVPLDDNEKALVMLKNKQSLSADLQKAMLDSYAKDYKIKIKYKLMGIED
ncbi:MAG: SurA N-terminal domain-containing protein [Alphaproteobacteria bacterium]|nr:SurA N-terminal domain-containing protein [Alphaproteobacteria bacterium]